jgi:hypothetical protein
MRVYLGRYGGTSRRCRADPWPRAPATASAGCDPALAPSEKQSTAEPKLGGTKIRFPGKRRARTSGGKQSSAARRGTEKPPCVLVSEAVSVLQNMCGIRGGRRFTASSPSQEPSSPSGGTRLFPSCSHRPRIIRAPLASRRYVTVVYSDQCGSRSTSLSRTSRETCAYTSSVAASACTAERV